MNLWIKVRRPIGYTLAILTGWAVLFLMHAIPELLTTALLGI